MAANHRFDHAWTAIRNMLDRELGDQARTPEARKAAVTKVASAIRGGPLEHYAADLGVGQIERTMMTQQRDGAQRESEREVVARRAAIERGEPVAVQRALPLGIQDELRDCWRGLTGAPMPIKGLCNRHQLRDQAAARRKAAEDLLAPIAAHDVLIEIVDRGAVATGEDLITPYELEARDLIQAEDIDRLLRALSRA